MQLKEVRIGKEKLQMLVDHNCESCRGTGVKYTKEFVFRTGTALDAYGKPYTCPITDTEVSMGYACGDCLDKGPARPVEEIKECPFCGSEVDWDLSFCCGEVGHGEVVYRFTEGYWAGEEATLEDYKKYMNSEEQTIGEAMDSFGETLAYLESTKR